MIWRLAKDLDLVHSPIFDRTGLSRAIQNGEFIFLKKNLHHLTFILVVEISLQNSYLNQILNFH